MSDSRYLKLFFIVCLINLGISTEYPGFKGVLCCVLFSPEACNFMKQKKTTTTNKQQLAANGSDLAGITFYQYMLLMKAVHQMYPI